MGAEMLDMQMRRRASAPLAWALPQRDHPHRSLFASALPLLHTGAVQTQLLSFRQPLTLTLPHRQLAFIIKSVSWVNVHAARGSILTPYALNKTRPAHLHPSVKTRDITWRNHMKPQLSKINTLAVGSDATLSRYHFIVLDNHEFCHYWQMNWVMAKKRVSWCHSEIRPPGSNQFFSIWLDVRAEREEIP